MNVLAMGLPLWNSLDQLQCYRSHAGHEVRHLAVDEPAHHRFTPGESATQVVERIGRAWRPDVLLCFCPEFYPPPREIEHCPVKTVAVVSDWNLYQPQFEYNLARFDLVLTDRLGSRRLALRNATPRYFEPLYAHRTLIHRRLNLARDVDIMFLGNLNHAIHRKRGRLLEQVAALSGDYRVFIGGEFSQEEYTRRMNRARIVVNHAVRREMNLRSFEAPACGALLFQEADNLEVPDWYEDGKHAVFYTPDDLTEKLRYYLEHERQREAIARNGWRRARALAAEHRMDRLFDWIEGQPRGDRGFHHFADRDKTMAEVMMLASSQVSGQADLLPAELASALSAYPGDAGFLLAAGCTALSAASSHTGDGRAKRAREALVHFNRATELAPSQAVPWINLAVVARQAGRGSLEQKALEMALDASEADHGGFLLGRIADPYYADWRLALAYGETDVALLHALAACRLATLALEAGDAHHGLHWARMSIAKHPNVAQPYRLAAIALSQMGDLEEALRQLQAGLPHTTFDAPYRRDLVAVYRALGRQEEARATAQATAHLFAPLANGAETAAEFETLTRA